MRAIVTGKTELGGTHRKKGLAPRTQILADVATELAKNLGMMIPPIRAWRLRRPRTVGELEEITTEVMEEFAFAPFEMVTACLPAAELRGATVVEIGPGDNVVLGLALLALGAGEYHAIDRFLGDVRSPRAQKLYTTVARVLPERMDVPASAVPEAGNFPKVLLGSKVFLHRRGIEEFRSVPLAGKADLVFSYGVGQSVASAEAFAQATAHFLKPGGSGVHAIQFGPVGPWTEYRNPLTFLTVPESVWKWTSSHRGGANRLRYHEFLALFEKAGLIVETETLEEFTEEEHEEAWPHLDRRFSLAPRDSLRVRFAKFVCRKPGPESRRTGSPS